MITVTQHPARGRNPRYSLSGTLAFGHAETTVEDRLVAARAGKPVWLTEDVLLVNAADVMELWTVRVSDGRIVRGVAHPGTIMLAGGGGRAAWSVGATTTVARLADDGTLHVEQTILDAFSPALSPDGSHVGYLAHPSANRGQTVVIDDQTVDGPAAIYDLRLGTHYACWSKGDGPRETWGCAMGGRPQRLHHAQGDSEFQPVPLDSWVLAHTDNPARLIAYHGYDGTTQGIVVVKGTTFDPDGWTDGREALRAAWADERGALWTADFTTGEPVVDVAKPTTVGVPSPAGTVVNVLPFFVGTDPALWPRTGSHALMQYRVGHERALVFVKFGQPTQTEHYAWNDTDIRLVQDGTDGHNRIWRWTDNIIAHRTMAVGETIAELASEIVYMTRDGQFQSRSRFPHTHTLEAHYAAYDCGGDLGVRPVIILRSGLGDHPDINYERFFYALGAGWFAWESYQQGHRSQRADFNTVGGVATVPTQAVYPIPPPPIVTPSMQPYPSEPDFWGAIVERDVALDYAEAGRVPDLQAFRWFARTGYDIAAGLTPAASWQKHRAEMRAVLGLPR